ncbi:hypothetical protein AV530_002626 [Patagioenas fasciata monilis]|uniref:Uncharacterized protein n=1 Tax=Patagioenas fasciata monilis TaxID=372326 RepID=A0A1V4K748_PATFA|nr:hypothetical protein AV530_002626 [Patagioenas fasciata monilis]
MLRWKGLILVKEQFLKLSFSNPLRPSASVPACLSASCEDIEHWSCSDLSPGCRAADPDVLFKIKGCISSRWDEIQSISCGFMIALLITQNRYGPAMDFSSPRAYSAFWNLLHPARLRDFSAVWMVAQKTVIASGEEEMLELRANTGTAASGHKVVGKSCRLEIKRLLTTRRNIQFKRNRQSHVLKYRLGSNTKWDEDLQVCLSPWTPTFGNTPASALRDHKKLSSTSVGGEDKAKKTQGSGNRAT